MIVHGVAASQPGHGAEEDGSPLGSRPVARGELLDLLGGGVDLLQTLSHSERHRLTLGVLERVAQHSVAEDAA